MIEQCSPRGSRQRGAARVPVVIGLILLTLAAVAAGAKWHAQLAGLFGGTPATSARRETSSSTRQLWTCGMHPQVIQDHPGDCPICHMELTPLASNGASTRDVHGERAVAYWWDPATSPPFISDRPGQSPSGTELVPVHADEVSAGTSVTIDPVVVQNMGLRTAVVTEGPLARTIRAVGYLEEPEPNHVDVNLRVSGWIEKLFADTDGMPVAKGDPLFELYSPELQIAIEDLIAARKARDAVPSGQDEARAMSVSLYASIEKKLELYGLEHGDVAAFARLDRAPATVTFKSPITGHLTEKKVVAGDSVSSGVTVMRVADRSTMWLDLRVFERDLPYVEVGAHVRATIEALPGRSLTGDVLFVHPHLDEVTRTALVRTVLDNHDDQLRQGMFATGVLDAQIATRTLLVPREAVIDTGERQIAFVVRERGRFEPRRVTLGAAGENGVVQVLTGLAPGESVVTSGQFLLDAESRMREAIQKHLDQGLVETPATAVSTSDKASTSVAAQSRAPASAAAVTSGAEAPRAKVDAVYTAYLDFAHALGAMQSSDAPIDTAALIRVSNALVDAAHGSTRTLASSVRDTASRLAGRSLGEQRETMKSLGQSMIALADRVPPSRSVAGKLYVMRCTMAPGDWLQSAPDVANPFYARSMKTCGEVLRTIDGAEPER
jgi:RND family efflux transporter MFP subunit